MWTAPFGKRDFAGLNDLGRGGHMFGLFVCGRMPPAMMISDTRVPIIAAR
jgi:hypothetical protein